MGEEAIRKLLLTIDGLITEGRLEEASRLQNGVEREHEEQCIGENREIVKYLRARILFATGSYPEALSLAESALRGLRDSGDRCWLGRCHLLISSILFRFGRFDESREHAEAAIYNSVWEVRDPAIEVKGHNLIGLSCKNLGSWAEAESGFRRALRISSQISGVELRLKSLLNLGILLRKIGKLDEAPVLCKEGLSLSGEAALPLHRCLFSLELGNIGVVKDEIEEARRYVGDAREIAEREGYRRERVLVREIEGDISFACGDYEGALGSYREGLELALEFAVGGDLEYELRTRLGRVLVRLGRLVEARSEVERSLGLTVGVGDRYEHALGLRALGEVEVGEGKVGLGIGHMLESVNELMGLSGWSPELGAVELELGRLLVKEGRSSEGLEHLYSARRIYSNLGISSRLREIDELIGGVVCGGMARGVRVGVSGRRGVLVGADEGLLRYGIVTADERIVGDVNRWGPSDVRVLIEGETGVGKELIARAMHRMSRWREGAFVVVDCAGLAASVVESELFGHVRGSFTGAVGDRRGLIEEADGGTLFLDEVGELSLDIQGKLLRVLDEGVVRRVGSNRGVAVRFRVISATNRDLGEAVSAGRFRRDLYHRLKGVLVRVPSLRERLFDVGLLVEHYVREYSERYGLEVELGEGVIDRLVGYSWPGNVRELRHVVEALVVGSGGGVIGLGEVESMLDGSVGVDIDRRRVEEALRASGGNKSEAARLLGISRTTLWHRMRLLGLS